MERHNRTAGFGRRYPSDFVEAPMRKLLLILLALGVLTVWSATPAQAQHWGVDGRGFGRDFRSYSYRPYYGGYPYLGSYSFPYSYSVPYAAYSGAYYPTYPAYGYPVYGSTVYTPYVGSAYGYPVYGGSVYTPYVGYAYGY
jgi:hypothetical protein